MADKKEEKKSKNPQSTGKKEDPRDKTSGEKAVASRSAGAKPGGAKSAGAKSGGAKPNGVKSPVSKSAATKPAGKASGGAKDTVAKSDASGTEQEPDENQSYLKDLMAISGHGGLFRFVSQGRSGIIVESLETGKRMQAFASMKVSSLEDIAVYTSEKEVQLEEVLAAIHKYENGKEAISPKSDADDLKDYFSAILPEYDRERVYVSDIKKILGWYNLLLKHNLIEPGKHAGKSHEKKEDDRHDHPNATAKPTPRAPLKKETGGVHSRVDKRASAKRIPQAGKKSP
jgi:hypothetical protein